MNKRLSLKETEAEAEALSSEEAPPYQISTQTEETYDENTLAFEDKKRQPYFARRIWRIIFCCLTPLICFLMVELLAENNPFSALKIWQWLFNILWYFWILLFGSLLFGKVRWGVRFALSFSFILGLANHYVLEFRGRALFPSDLLSVKTALNVFTSYNYSPDRYILGAACILAAGIGLTLLFPKEKNRVPKEWFKKLTLGAGLALFAAVFFFSPLLETCDIYAQQWKTKGNGFLLNFTTALHYMRLSAPEGYKEEDAEEIIGALLPSDTVKKASKQAAGNETEKITATNFIIIMDESFADYTQFENLTLSEDPTPFYHSLTENTLKGSVITPVTGGGTPAVEFEALTGSTMTFLPSGTVAYQLYLSEHFPSLSWNADSLSFWTAAYHPYLSSGWNRTTAYRQLGFAAQYYLNEMDIEADSTPDGILQDEAYWTSYEDSELIREYVSDAADFSRIYTMTEAAKEAGESCFIFNVTMQNHSAYDKAWNNLSKTATVTGEFAHKGYDNSTAQYLALARETDNALKELIAYYESVPEPTCILFFGDHQPPLSNTFYEDLYGKDLDSRFPAEVLTQYQTPFFIWTNYDLDEQIDAVLAEDEENAKSKDEEAQNIWAADKANFEDKENVTIGTNFAGILAARLAGMPQTGWMKYVMSLNAYFIGMTRSGILTREGKAYETVEALPETEQKLLEEYEKIQYYLLMGDDDMDSAFFFLRED